MHLPGEPWVPVRYVVAVPLYNARADVAALVAALRVQVPAPRQIMLLDSSRDDEQVVEASDVDAGAVPVLHVRVMAFDHGGTRNLALRLAAREAEVCLFLTQDAILSDVCSAATLVMAFGDPLVWAATGRQVPRLGADPIEERQRSRRYPEDPEGSAVLLSNAFSAYRIEPFLAMGGFTEKILWGEDYSAAFHIQSNGGKVVYEPRAVVRHSHRFSVRGDFKRFFDAGAAAAIARRQGLETLRAAPEGLPALARDMSYFLPASPLLALHILWRFGIRSLGYSAGFASPRLPKWMILRLTSNRAYWRVDDSTVTPPL